MNLIKLITKSLISICINLIIYIISSFIPKSKKIWLFGGWFGRRFADNSRYFYLYCNQFKEELGLDKVIWITEDACIYDDLKSKGFEVYKKWSIKSIWYHFRAKNIFVDQGPNDVNKYFCIRCNRINMWHGFPLKKIGSLVESIDFKLDDLYNKYFKLGGWSKYYLQVTSKLSREILSKAFNINDRRTIMSGYPRNDVFSNDYWNCYLSESERIAMNNIQIYKKKGYNVIFYLPTFRDNKNIELLNIKSQVELQELTEFLKNNKILLVTKFHFAQDDTQFEYSNLQVEKQGENLSVQFILKNIGEMQGKETAQLYIEKIGAEGEKTFRQLKGFEKVDLVPGEEKEVTLILQPNDFMAYNIQKKAWEIESSWFKIAIGTSVENIKLEKVVNL